MGTSYKIVYSGSLKPGTDVEQFVQGFMKLFKAPEANARKLAAAGRAITLKDQLDHAQAEKYRERMDMLGMQVRVEPTADASPPLGLMPDQAPAPSATATQKPTPSPTPTDTGGVRCPKCGSNRVQGDDCLACGVIISRYNERQARLAAEAAANPYAAPQSDVTPVHDGDPSVMSGPHAVPAGNGWRWIVEGWDYFRRNPLAWIGAIVVWLILIVAVSLVPLLGSVALNLLGPVFTAGFLLGANAQREGGDFELRHLFAGFSNHPGSLILVGLFYLIGMVLILAIAAMIFGGALFTLGGMQPESADPRTLMATLGGALLLVLALSVPLLMAYWFAPALVALEGVSPFAAMKLSFTACLKNVMPFLVYSLAAIVLAIVAVIPVGLGMIILVPVMIATMYASYRDIFYQSSQA